MCLILPYRGKFSLLITPPYDSLYQLQKNPIKKSGNRSTLLATVPGHEIRGADLGQQASIAQASRTPNGFRPERARGKRLVGFLGSGLAPQAIELGELCQLLGSTLPGLGGVALGFSPGHLQDLDEERITIELTKVGVEAAAPEQEIHPKSLLALHDAEAKALLCDCWRSHKLTLPSSPHEQLLV